VVECKHRNPIPSLSTAFYYLFFLTDNDVMNGILQMLELFPASLYVKEMFISHSVWRVTTYVTDIIESSLTLVSILNEREVYLGRKN